MTLSFESDGDYLAMSRDERVICRVRTDMTDLGDHEDLSGFVRRHGGIDATLDYMKDIKVAAR